MKGSLGVEKKGRQIPWELRFFSNVEKRSETAETRKKIVLGDHTLIEE